MRKIHDDYKQSIDVRMAQPTAPPPEFIPNKAQAMQMPTETIEDNALEAYQMSLPMGFNKNNKINNKNKNKNKNKNNKKVKAVDPGAIRPCLYRYVYIWPRNRREQPYWMYVTYVGRRSIAGWRYSGRRWVYYSTALREIDSFYCY